MQIKNLTVRCLLDSGASVSCMSVDFLKKLKLPMLPLKEGDSKNVFLADNRSVKVLGKAVMTINISGLGLPCEVLILPEVGFNLILGLDFLQSGRAKVDFEENVVRFFDNLTSTRLSTVNVRLPTVFTLHATVLPPLSETLVPILLPTNCSSHVSIIEPLEHVTKRKFICARSIIDSSGRTAVCKILNPTNHVLWLSRHKPLASIEPVTSNVLAAFTDHTITRHSAQNSAEQLDDMMVQRETDVSKLSDLGTLDLNSDKAAGTKPSGENLHRDAKSNLFGTKQSSDASRPDAKCNDFCCPECPVQSTSLQDLKINYHSDHLSDDENAKLKDFLQRNASAFSQSLADLGKTDYVQHSIITGDATPVHQRAYRHSIAAKAEIAKQTKQMLDAGIIEPSSSCWSSPVVLVRKKSGQIRFCVDYRKLNAVTKSISFPLPQLNDVFDAMAEGRPKYFSLLDLRSGYHQLPLHPDTKEKSSFVTHEGQFQFRTSPFGLKNLPSFFQLLMARVFQNLHFKNVLVYLDDILIYSKSFDLHLVHLQEVFNRLKDANLKLNPEKCAFGLDKILYLGHVLGPEGVSVDNSKIEVIQSYPRPTCPKEIRSFLGLASYYRRFITNFSIIASPLHRLLKKDLEFVWDDYCEQAFTQLKEALATAPVLIYPDMQRPFVINCDASSQAIGFVLAQEDGSGRERPIAYGGRSLTSSERAYSVSELEMLSMVSAIKQFHCYLANTRFTVYTDHLSLKYLQSLKNSNSGRLLRWSLLLQQYDFTIEYKQGKINSNADALSRRHYPVQADESDDMEDKILAPVVVGVTPVQLNIIVEEDLITPADLTEEDILRQTAHEQITCSDCGPMIRYLEFGELPGNDQDARKIVIESTEYALCDGLLFHYYQPRSRGPSRTYINQLVVPRKLRQRILESYHDDCCHPGFHRCYLSIRRKYFWKGMHTAVSRHIISCLKCQECKFPLPLNKPPLTSLPIKQIFGRWHMDILQLPRSRDGYKYILLCVESLTRWPEAIMLKDQTARSIAEALYREIFSRYGGPHTLLSDRGPNFLSTIVSELSTLFGVQRIHTASYNPRS